MTCDELVAMAPDIALDALTGAERAAALGHLAGCESCRALVADLAVVADAVLLTAPSVEPPPGFESRVLGRLTATPVSPRRRWTWVAAAAAVAALLGGGVGYAIADRPPGRSLPVAAVLHGRDGVVSGTVVLAAGPNRMTCVFEDPHFGGAYSVEVVLANGKVTSVGEFSAQGAPWSWTVDLPVDAGDVRAVHVLDDSGVLRASAELD